MPSTRVRGPRARYANGSVGELRKVIRNTVCNKQFHADSDGPPYAPPRFSFHFITVGYVLTVLLLGANVPTPLYGIYRSTFGFTPFTQTAIFAVYAAGLIPALLFFGPLSDKFGRRLVLLMAVVLALCAALLMAYASEIYLLFVGRTMQGVSIGAVSAAGVAALTEHEPRKDSSKAAIVGTLATVLGAALGPLFGGAAAQYFKPTLQAPYFGFMLMLIPAVGALVWLPDKRREAVTGLRYFNKPSVPRVIRRVFWLVAARVAVAWGAVGLFQSIIPAYVATTLGIDDLVLIGGIAALVMVLSVVAQLGLARLCPANAQMTGLVAVGGGMTALLVVDLYPTPAALLVSATLVGFGHGLVFSGGMRELNTALATSSVGEDASVIAGFLTINYVGMAVPSLCAGMAVTAFGFSAAVVAFTIVGVLLCVLGLVVSATFAAEKAH
jgi:MFS family permease